MAKASKPKKAAAAKKQAATSGYSRNDNNATSSDLQRMQNRFERDNPPENFMPAFEKAMQKMKDEEAKGGK